MIALNLFLLERAYAARPRDQTGKMLFIAPTPAKSNQTAPIANRRSNCNSACSDELESAEEATCRSKNHNSGCYAAVTAICGWLTNHTKMRVGGQHVAPALHSVKITGAPDLLHMSHAYLSSKPRWFRCTSPKIANTANDAAFACHEYKVGICWIRRREGRDRKDNH